MYISSLCYLSIEHSRPPSVPAPRPSPPRPPAPTFFFCQSAKLAFAFGLHDEDGDERLTRRGLWRYTRSFLTALMALSFASSSLSAEELTRAVDDGAVWTSAAIFAETATQTPNRIGFDEFAAW